MSSTSNQSGGNSWTDEPNRFYPYASHDIDVVPRHRQADSHNRNVASLLASIGAFAHQIPKANTPGENPGDYTIEELNRFDRVCNNGMTMDDYMRFHSELFDEPTRETTAILHLNVLEIEEPNVPNFTQFEDIILSTFSSTGKVVLFLIVPSQSTIDAFCTTAVAYDEVKDILKALLKLLSNACGKAFTVNLRLRIPDGFHPDPLFMALFLVAIIQQRGKYHLITPRQILEYKLWMIGGDIIQVHDTYLGQLSIPSITRFSHPFQVPIPDYCEYKLFEKKGWHVLDVDGDGHCGYYSLFLGLRNVGIDQFHINTADLSIREGRPLWQDQVIALRERLKAGSDELLEEVFPKGSPNRSLEWWGLELGKYTDEERDALSDSFLIPNCRTQSRYFSKSFRTNKAMHQYHVDPYWSCLVASYVFRVRVVLITRLTSPKENDTNEAPSVVYSYNTRIFEFKSDFESSKDNYVPITSCAKCLRINDVNFHSKPTIELLYTTGFKRKGKGGEDDSHFLFLRRIFWTKIRPNLSISETQLCNYVPVLAQGTRTEVEQPSGCIENAEESAPMDLDNEQVTVRNAVDTPDHPDATNNEDPLVDVEAVATAVVEALAPMDLDNEPESVTMTEKVDTSEHSTDHADVPVDVETVVFEEVPEVQTGVASHQPKSTGKTLLPAKRKKGPTVGGKNQDKRATKKKQNTKLQKNAVLQKSVSKQAPTSPEQDSENQSQLANTPESPNDVMYDRRSGRFFTARFNNKLKRYLNKKCVEDISTIDPELLQDARNNPDTWISPPIGDPWDDPPPQCITTKVKCLYEQLDNHYCITYCVASALFYCGFTEEARELAQQAPDLAKLHMKTQVESLRSFMGNLVPPIGGPTVYGKRVAGNKKMKRPITWTDLFSDITPYPTLVIPAKKTSGRMTHAFCVVDDLIFDSSATHALKLQMESVNWIFQDEPVDIFMALRFNKKVSPMGHKVRWTYTREVTYNWSKEKVKRHKNIHRHVTAVPNTCYDVEYAFMQHFKRMEITP